MKTDSVVSRPFTSKDTHSSHGDLLVVHGSGKVAYYDRELAKQTAAVLGFQSPSFTFNTDLFLPVGANADLREVLVSGRDNEERERHEGALEALQSFMTMRNMSAVPQVSVHESWSRKPRLWPQPRDSRASIYHPTPMLSVAVAGGIMRIVVVFAQRAATGAIVIFIDMCRLIVALSSISKIYYPK